MIRALIWKEYRELRWTLLGYIAILCLLKVGFCFLTAENVEAGYGTYWNASTLLLFSFPFFALILGASTFSHEEGNRTLPFLMTKPVSRKTVFVTKVIVALTMLIAATFLASFTANDKIGLGWDEMTAYIAWSYFHYFLAILIYAFGMGILGSQFCSGTLTSSVVGGAVGAISFFGIIYCDLIEPLFPLLVTLGVGTILVAAATTTGREVLPLKQRAQNATRAFLILLAVTYAGLHCWNAWQNANPGPFGFTGINAEQPDGLTITTFSGEAETMRLRTFVKRGNTLARWKKHDNTEVDSWSPKGKNVLELDWSNHWGTRRTFGAIPRIYDSKGEEIWSGRLGRYETPICWSEKGNKIAVEFRYNKHFFGRQQYALLIGDIQNKDFRQIDCGLFNSIYSIELLGWQKEESLLAIAKEYKDGKEKASIIAIDLQGKKTATYTPFEEDSAPYVVGRLDSGVFIFSQKIDDNQRVLLNWTPDKKAEIMATHSTDWRAKAISPDGKWVFLLNRNIGYTSSDGKRMRAIEYVKRLKVEKKLACLQLGVSSADQRLEPQKTAILASEKCQLRTIRHDETTVFWSTHYSGFVYVEGYAPGTRKVVLYDPCTSKKTTIICENELVLH